MELTKSFSKFVLLFCLIAVLEYSFAVPLQRDLREATNKFTCKHKSEASNKDWKKCNNNISDALGLTDMDIPLAIVKNRISSISVPVNTFKCFRTSTYSPSKSGTDCPAFCRLRDMKKSDECKVGDALNVDHLEEHEIAIVKSPRYDCSEEYYRNEVCVYNISMNCADNSHTEISLHGSEIDLGDGDFIDIFNYKDTSKRFPSIAGQSLIHSQLSIPETDFIMVFTSNRDPKQGKGFKLQLECPDIKQPATPPTEGIDFEDEIPVISSGDNE